MKFIVGHSATNPEATSVFPVSGADAVNLSAQDASIGQDLPGLIDEANAVELVRSLDSSLVRRFAHE